MNTSILLVDDEASLVRLMKKYLERVGFNVDTAESGAEAWEKFERAGQSYALVIVDLTLPDIEGRELLRRMAVAKPELAAVVCSGSPVDPADQILGRFRYLQKPFLPKMLAQVVNDALSDA